ncbi:Gfo/Idh/MocA family oxidoreductase [Streptomyces sp. NPDC048409]|uniref:Gfo/Idh/MocA family oxidoreductase n=1 Tax=Streptomyces sp. NPDC048409 TaxID=3154723 RepID=UPI0034196AF3
MNPFRYFAHRASQWSPLPVLSENPERHLRICVEGFGDWGNRVYRPAIKAARDGGARISALYRDIRAEARVLDLTPWEEFEIKQDPFEPPHNAPDLVIVATPDSAHTRVLRAAARQEAAVIVEKPFGVTAAEVIRTRALPGLVLGVDHFPAYIAAATGQAEQIWEHLGGEVDSVRFVLLQRTPVEATRLPSLGTGLTFDMLPHFLALLVSLGLTGPVADAVLTGAGQHVPLVRDGLGERLPWSGNFAYQAETWSETRFTLTGTSTRHAVVCTGLVGKGFPLDARFLELGSPSGAAVRLDLGSPSWQDTGYPCGTVALLTPPLARDHSTWLLPDPSRIRGTGPRLVTTRPYESIIAQFTGGAATPRASSCLFSLDECEWIMSVLEPLGTDARHLAIGEGGTDHRLGEYPVLDNGRIWC